jgi:hypothetical protein
MATDSYLALVAGREVAAHGLPHTDTLCVVSTGHVWTDQQWLGQLLLWAVDRVAGLHGLFLSLAFVTAAAFGLCAWHASKAEASPAAVFVASAAGFAIGVPFFTPRPQMFSVLGFAVLLIVLSADVKAPSRRVWWLIPMMALWANLHGVVVIGALLVMLRAAFDVFQRRIARGVALGSLAACTPFCTPYALELPRYFREIGHLQDPARRLPILEWGRVSWPSDIPFFCIFAATMLLLIFVYVKKKSRGTFESLVILGTGLGAWQACRHLQWFGLALAAYGPQLLDAVPAIRDGHVLGRVAKLLSVLAPVALVVALIRFALMRDDTIEQDYPNGMLPTLADAVDQHPGWHLAASDRFADWALWHVPAVRGRIENDVRFELIDEQQARDMGAFLFPEPGWEAIYKDAKLILVARKFHPALDKKVGGLPGVQVLWESDLGRLVVR